MKEQGLVMVLALLILLSLTILGVSAVSSSLSQSKMAVAMQQGGMAFDAAEAGIAGVFFESEDEVLLADDTKLDPLSEARQGNTLDPTIAELSCNNDADWTNRQMTASGLTTGSQHNAGGSYQSTPSTQSWSRTAFVREQACRGSSNVIGGSNVTCHVFIIRGCGKVEGNSSIVANSLSASVIAPASQ